MTHAIGAEALNCCAVMISTLDTHELVKDLKASGFTDAQAEAVTRAVRTAPEFDVLEPRDQDRYRLFAALEIVGVGLASG